MVTQVKLSSDNPVFFIGAHCRRPLGDFTSGDLCSVGGHITRLALDVKGMTDTKRGGCMQFGCANRLSAAPPI